MDACAGGGTVAIDGTGAYVRASWQRGARLYWRHPVRHAGRWFAFMARRLRGDRLLHLRNGSGHALVSPRDNFTAMAVAVLGERDPDIMRLLRRHVRTGETVFDVGANIGTYTLPLAHLVGSGGRVVAFEPNRRTRACLRHNVRANRLGQVVIVASAAGPEAGRVTLVAPNQNLGEVHVRPDEHGAVPMTTLDAEAVRLGCGAVSFIKLDIEGFELAALRGAMAILRGSPRILVQTEVVPSHAARFGHSWEDLRGFFAELGFASHACDPAGRLVAQPDFKAEVGDWFWLRPDNIRDA